MIAVKNVYSTRRGLIVVDRHAAAAAPAVGRARTHARITVALCENASVGFDSTYISIKYNFANPS